MSIPQISCSIPALVGFEAKLHRPICHVLSHHSSSQLTNARSRHPVGIEGHIGYPLEKLAAFYMIKLLWFKIQDQARLLFLWEPRNLLTRTL